MLRGIFSFVLLCLFVILIVSLPANAEWIENGKAVCADPDPQGAAKIVRDNAGGSIIVWLDSRLPSPSEIYAQRVDEYGTDMWVSDGVPVYSGYAAPREICVVSDGSSGAFIAVLAEYDSLFVQRIYADGTTWNSPQGTPICENALQIFNPEYISLAPDGGGGVIVTWVDSRSLLDIYAQRVDAYGNVKWTANGVSICSEGSFQYSPICAPDLEGGAVITWTDDRNGNKDIYAQRIDSTGTVLWTVNGVPVGTGTSAQDRPRIISGGDGGAVIAWMDTRDGSDNTYLQKLNGSGTAQWTANGLAAATPISGQDKPRLATDGDGGVIVAWMDVRNTLLNTDVYAQRINSAGTVLWESDGEPICTAPEQQSYPKITEDGAGGAVIVWPDQRNSNYDFYAQRIGGDGGVMWGEDGIPVCTGQTGNRFDLAIDYAGPRGIVIAWDDQRIEADIYMQAIDFDGNWGYPTPVIYSTEDVPGDQGGYINLFWYASVWDHLLYDEITYYTLWRAVEPQQAMAALDAGAMMLEDPTRLDRGAFSRVTPGDISPHRIIRRMETEAAIYFWELVGTQQAYLFPAYAMTIPTQFDSTAEHHAYHYFQVLAHRSEQDYYTSAIDSAYSVDNLSPAEPTGMSSEQSYAPEGLQLTWDQNEEEDFANYTVYRGSSEGFVPGPGNRIASVSANDYFDDEWTWDSGYWYKLAAVDVHGNESDYTVTGPDAVTGDDPMPAPNATFLAQNWPNPFNPSTTIAFGLKERGPVSLRIYNAAGRLVRVLIDESRPAGQYTTVWNGQDQIGATAASGVYFYMLKTGEFEETKKMILLR